eukprot:scaffold42414_cov42-Phaeocystis_antarctica.AAC.1
MQFLWRTELPCARGRGPVWRGAGGRVPYRLRVVPRPSGAFSGGPPVCRHQTAFQWQRSTLLGIAGGDLACMPRPAPLASWGSRAYWPIGSPITGRQEPCMRLGHHGEAGAALACRCPVRGTSGPRCLRAGRSYPAGLP